VERFNLKKLNELRDRKEYQIKSSKRFTALESLSDSKEIYMAWEEIKENIKMPAKDSLVLLELTQHKSYFDEKRLIFFGSRETCKNGAVTGSKPKQSR
jgi:hypothetical protein